VRQGKKGVRMGGIGNATATVTIRVKRFAPRPERPNRSAVTALRKPASPFGSTRKRPRGKQWSQEYTLRVHPHDTVLDCLLIIKRTLDPTLAFRYSCGHGMCGSDAVAVNGTPTLLCTARISDYAKQLPQNTQNEGFRRTATVNRSAAATRGFAASGGNVTETNTTETTEDTDANSVSATDANATVVAAEGTVAPTPLAPDLGIIELAPLPGFPVQRDLIADIDPMLDQIKRLQPYLQADGKLATTREGKVDVFEYLQKPEQLAKYELLSNCIACGVCEGSCPVFAGGEAFIGPAALVMASRFLNDSRDDAAQQRLDAIDTADGIAACQSVRACGRQCPRGIDVGEEMWQLTTAVRER
jgi:succinate dehydrogenase / fumarate reductase iron-sulfur subunit